MYGEKGQLIPLKAALADSVVKPILTSMWPYKKKKKYPQPQSWKRACSQLFYLTFSIKDFPPKYWLIHRYLFSSKNEEMTDMIKTQKVKWNEMQYDWFPRCLVLRSVDEAHDIRFTWHTIIKMSCSLTKSHSLPSVVTLHALNESTVCINIKYHGNMWLIVFSWTN